MFSLTENRRRPREEDGDIIDVDSYEPRRQRKKIARTPESLHPGCSLMSDAEFGKLFPPADIKSPQESSSTHPYKSEHARKALSGPLRARARGVPKPAEMELESILHNGQTLRRRKTVELEDGSFLRISAIKNRITFGGGESSEIYLQGPRFERTRQYHGLLMLKKNEVAMCSPSETVPLAQVLRTRLLVMTNANFPEFRDITWDEEWDEIHGRLVCRWKIDYVSKYEGYIRRVQKCEADKGFQVEESALKREWRGGLVNAVVLKERKVGEREKENNEKKSEERPIDLTVGDGADEVEEISPPKNFCSNTDSVSKGFGSTATSAKPSNTDFTCSSHAGTTSATSIRSSASLESRGKHVSLSEGFAIASAAQYNCYTNSYATPSIKRCDRSMNAYGPPSTAQYNQSTNPCTYSLATSSTGTLRCSSVIQSAHAKAACQALNGFGQSSSVESCNSQSPWALPTKSFSFLRKPEHLAPQPSTPEVPKRRSFTRLYSNFETTKKRIGESKVVSPFSIFPFRQCSSPVSSGSDENMEKKEDELQERETCESEGVEADDDEDENEIHFSSLPPFHSRRPAREQSIDAISISSSSSSALSSSSVSPSRSLSIIDYSSSPTPKLHKNSNGTSDFEFTRCLSRDANLRRSEPVERPVSIDLRSPTPPQIEHNQASLPSIIPSHKPASRPYSGGIISGPQGVKAYPKMKQKSTPVTKRKYTFGDAFCGGGGMASGARSAGFINTWGFDFNAEAISTYQKNFPECTAYLAAADSFVTSPPEDLFVDVVHFSPPCQPHSPAHTIAGKDDDRNEASLFCLTQCLEIARPRMATLEQTDGILNRPEWFNSMVLCFTALGFSVSWKVLRGVEYGLPQNRKRLFLLAASPGEELPSFPTPTYAHPNLPQTGHLLPTRTIRDAISSIPPNATCHNPEEKFIRPRGPPPEWDKPLNATILAGGGQYDVHPSGIRSFTIRELACLQTFPVTHEFFGSDTQKKRQIGNAVPPILAEALMKEVRKALEKADNGREGGGESEGYEGAKEKSEDMVENAKRNEIEIVDDEDSDLEIL